MGGILVTTCPADSCEVIVKLDRENPLKVDNGGVVNLTVTEGCGPENARNKGSQRTKPIPLYSLQFRHKVNEIPCLIPLPGWYVRAHAFGDGHTTGFEFNPSQENENAWRQGWLVLVCV